MFPPVTRVRRSSSLDILGIMPEACYVLHQFLGLLTKQCPCDPTAAHRYFLTHQRWSCPERYKLLILLLSKENSLQYRDGQPHYGEKVSNARISFASLFTKQISKHKTLGKFFSQLHTNLTINAQDVCKIS
jgi:hypothetical protein